MKSDEKMKKLGECIFDLTLIAYDILSSFPDAREIDSRELFYEVYDLANQFEYNWKGGDYPDDGFYLEDIEYFGREKLRKFFGLDIDGGE